MSKKYLYVLDKLLNPVIHRDLEMYWKMRGCHELHRRIHELKEEQKGFAATESKVDEVI